MVQWTVWKAVPAIIFLVTAIQMLSDNLPWWPAVGRHNVDGYTRVSKDIWNSSTDDVDADTTVSYTAPSDIVAKQAVEQLLVPKNYTPVRAGACRVEPDGNPDSYVTLLADAGGIGSDHNCKEASQGCWESCRDLDGCGSWFWCDSRDGCIDHNGRHFPYKGCELRRWEVIKTLGDVPSNWKLSSFATGFMHPIVPVEQVGQYTLNKLGAKIVAKPKQNMIITTSLWPKPCKKPGGDQVNRLSILNKIDYARMHGYEFHLFTHVVDKSLPKLYSKVGLLRQLLIETTRDRAEWILWIDADTIIMDMPFQMPFHLYKGKSFIAWGYEDYLLAGNQRHGLNTGTLLLRNDKEFSTRFWRDVAHVSRINQQLEHGNPNTPEGRIKMELEDQVQISGSFQDLCDQNVMIYLLRVKAKEYMPETLLEDGRYCMSCWYKDLPAMQAHVPFVNHYAACQMCTATNPMKFEGGEEAVKWSRHCHTSFMENYKYTNHTLAVILGCETEMKQWGPPLGLPLDRMFDCAGKRGQPTCPPLPPLPNAKPQLVSAPAAGAKPGKTSSERVAEAAKTSRERVAKGFKTSSERVTDAATSAGLGAKALGAKAQAPKAQAPKP